MILQEEKVTRSKLETNIQNINWNYPTPIKFGVDRIHELAEFIYELGINTVKKFIKEHQVDCDWNESGKYFASSKLKIKKF